MIQKHETGTDWMFCRPYYPAVRSWYCFLAGGGYLLQQMINRISAQRPVSDAGAQRRYS